MQLLERPFGFRLKVSHSYNMQNPALKAAERKVSVDTDPLWEGGEVKGKRAAPVCQAVWGKTSKRKP
jgi:hypothetical protein